MQVLTADFTEVKKSSVKKCIGRSVHHDKKVQCGKKRNFRDNCRFRRGLQTGFDACIPICRKLYPSDFARTTGRQFNKRSCVSQLPNHTAHQCREKISAADISGKIRKVSDRNSGNKQAEVRAAAAGAEPENGADYDTVPADECKNISGRKEIAL